MRTPRRKQAGYGPALRESMVSPLVLVALPTRCRFRWLGQSGGSTLIPDGSASCFAVASGGIVPCFPRPYPFCQLLSILRRFRSRRLVHVGGRRALSVRSGLRSAVDLGPVPIGAPCSRGWPARLHSFDRLAAALPRCCVSPCCSRPCPCRRRSCFESRARRYFSTFTSSIFG